MGLRKQVHQGSGIYYGDKGNIFVILDYFYNELNKNRENNIIGKQMKLVL
jgi:hypothetical protein